ncbi:MAG: hypothetical protein V4613_11270 [Bacteroidota bacterium]
MQTIQFSININADVQKVWSTMLTDSTYREWTKAFHESSYFSGSWDEGSEIRFLGVDEKGELQGMYSRIAKNIPLQFISIEHLGMVSNGLVDTTSDEVKKWAPSFENYTFTVDGDSTIVTVDIDVSDEYKEMFEGMWPNALKALKAICER